MSDIGLKFRELKERGERALIVYLVAGDPYIEYSREFIRALEAGGADMIGIGVPSSQLIVESPVVWDAHLRALNADITLQDVLNLIEEVRRTSEIPIILISYYNPILKMGEWMFMERCGELKVDGVMVVDLPLEEGEDYSERARRNGIAPIFSLSPRSGSNRIMAIGARRNGFLHLIGVEMDEQGAAQTWIGELRPQLPERLPLVIECRGTSIDQAGIAALLRLGVDGVIIWDALVERIGRGENLEQIQWYIGELKGGTTIGG
ncbi:MAG: tryptophan synthase subunit alpha [Candidatus Bipolaricaulia bacterium]